MNETLQPRVMSLGEFAPLVGATFHADCGEAHVPIVLMEAVPPPGVSSNDGRVFSLVFRSNPDALLVDGIYVLQANGFGPDYVTLTSLQRPLNSPPGYYYQSVFT